MTLLLILEMRKQTNRRSSLIPKETVIGVQLNSNLISATVCCPFCFKYILESYVCASRMNGKVCIYLEHLTVSLDLCYHSITSYLCHIYKHSNWVLKLFVTSDPFRPLDPDWHYLWAYLFLVSIKVTSQIAPISPKNSIINIIALIMVVMIIQHCN